MIDLFAAEKSRLLMSTQLTEQVGTTSLESSLNRIDSWSERVDKPPASSLAIGPFSVIDFNNATTSPSLVQLSDSVAIISDTPQSIETLNSLPDYLQWSDLFDLDFENYLASLPELSGFDNGLNNDIANVRSTSLAALADMPSLAASSLRSPVMDDEDFRNEAPFLLKHFSEHVIPSIGALPFNTKSPYQILNVSAAVQTLADITYMDRHVKHANAANLYGLMACSAYFLASDPSGSATNNAGYWSDLASKAGRKAKEHMQKSLQRELPNGSKAKYKDQLMALMSNLAYSIAAGQQKDTRCYMVDTERLVRIRGLAKRHISRRARLLHHMYTWSRIVGESTYVLHDVKLYVNINSKFSRAMPTETGHSSKLDDFLRIDQDEDEPQPEEIKAHDIGLTDIHLQDPRLHPETLYLQIYGIPETWLSLLSQTTRLANVKDMLEATNNESSEMQKVLERRAARLEDMICTFAAKTDHTSADGTNLAPSQYMLRALSSALVIFYYRRIKHVNPWILQSHVDDVILALQSFDESLTKQNLRGPGTAWPAFVAGCEAGVGSRRDTLMNWIETAFWKTGFQSFKSAQEIMKEVWARRDQTKMSPRSVRAGTNSVPTYSHSTWIEICREKNEWVILC